MAGQPRLRGLTEELERRTREEFEDTKLEQKATHLDYVCTWIMSGGTLTKLMEEISAEVGLGELTIGMLRRYLLRVWPSECDRRLADARSAGAHAKVEQAQTIIEDVVGTGLLGAVTREDLTHAKMKADTRLWQAERNNKAELGRGDGVNIQINMNEMHLDAMRVRTIQLEQVKRQSESLAVHPHARLIGSTGVEEVADVIDYDIVEECDAAKVLKDNNLDLFAPDQTSVSGAG